MRRRRNPGLVAIVCLGLLVPVVGVAVVVGLIPTEPERTAAVPTERSERTGTSTPPTGTGEVHESDYPDTWDTPDDVPVTPDDQLTQPEIDALLQTSAAADAGSTCAPEHLTLSFRVVDAAAGTIFGYLLAEATQPCTVVGWPGLGARGEWGDPLPMQIDPEGRGWDGSALEAAPVALAAGGCAVVPLRWTGERAGALSQAVSSAVVQLAEGSLAVLVTNPPKGSTDWIDWTINSHLYPGPWQPDPGLCTG
ncbi:DUF4232 domain-containing protein [Pseudactinotalea suaedae]|uniref:DUF4232 domain-containing protein n=1 Tax=Pseudactinotalea suaedae TaxID=1524924 RepID=UPI0013913B04|nr:DUF4232 domain-containing protein [Pseudactinotalea suaedae]